jgi:hypothetical protein
MVPTSTMVVTPNIGISIISVLLPRDTVVVVSHTIVLTSDQNCMHEEIKSRPNSEIACYCSVQSL